MRTTLTIAALLLTSASAFAAAPEGIKLSEIIAKIEQTTDFKYIDEIDWDNDGYYEIEYYLQNGTEVEVKIDPKTGENVK